MFVESAAEYSSILHCALWSNLYKSVSAMNAHNKTERQDTVLFLHHLTLLIMIIMKIFTEEYLNH